MVDPVTLGIGAAALFGGSLAAGLAPKAPSPTAPAAPPTPAQSPTGSSTSNKHAQAPSFLASAAAPLQQNTANKTLLGQ